MYTDQQSSIIDQSTLADIVTFVWQTLLGSELEPAEPTPIDHAVYATISVGGPWTATLEVTVSSELAHRFAADLLGIEQVELDPDDVDDALGELANVVGGNVKGVLDDGGASTLSLPVVSHAAQAIAGGQLTVSTGFVADGQPMRWDLFERP